MCVYAEFSCCMTVVNEMFVDDLEIKMKKQLTVLCVITLVLTACAFPAADAEEPLEAEREIPLSREVSAAQNGTAGASEVTGEDGIKEEKPKETEEEPVTEQAAEKENVDPDSENTTDIQNEMRSQEDSRARELYETFMNQEYAGIEDYAYVIYDADGDKCSELYIGRGSRDSFYVITYVNEGLCIEYQKEIPSEVSEIPWISTETLAETQSDEMAHSGIYACIDRDNFWYPNEECFVAAIGFDNAEPFFEYFLPDGQKRLTFYYDAATQMGCGIRYYERDPSTFTTTGMYGFAFEGLQEGGEISIREDFLKPEVYDGREASDYVEGFTENVEYDEQGRITHYDAGGMFMRDRIMEFVTILWIDYAYYGNENLKSRFYWHAGLLFGSSHTTWNCYFDEQGRIMHEDSYITHGSYETYYIYTDDTEEPAYILNLDNCMGEWIPDFRKGK